MKDKKGGILFLIMLLIVPFAKIYADDFSVALSCPNTVTPGENVNCTVSITSSTPITDLTASYDMSGNLGDSLNFENSEGLTEGNVGTLNFSIPSDANSNQEYIVNLKDISANSGALVSENKTATMRVKSIENRLQSLSLSKGSISFNSDTTEYNNINVDSDVSSITISATAKDSEHATVEGAGQVSLNFGLNIIKIKVIPELGTANIYTLNITRADARSSNNYLSSLAISNTNFNFNKDVVTYNLTTTTDKIFISAAKEDTKATVLGDTGNKTLELGKKNTFKITVVAENGAERVYTINITRTDARSSNNYLKSITLSKGTLNFNKNTITYNVDVENEVEKVKIDAVLDDSKSTFVSGYGPREVGLKQGNNTFELRVKNEKGELKTYTININRKDGRDSNSELKSITLSEGKIDFKPGTLEYKVNVEYKVEKIKVEAIPKSDKAKVTIEGAGDLVLGANTIKITVEAENGKKTIYTIIVMRKEEGYVLSSNNYITSLTIKNHVIDFSSDVYEYTISTKENKLSLSISLEDKKAKYEVIGNKKLKDGSKVIIKVTAENGDTREYTINIEKKDNLVIIIIIILVTIITAGLVSIVLLKRKKRVNGKVKKEEKIEDEEDFEDIETLEDDFSEV